MVPLRNSYFNWLLVALFTAPAVFPCLEFVNANPLENDLSGDGVPSHSNITHSPLGVRADWPEYNPEDFETDSETSSDDEDNETYAGSDNGEPPIDVVDSNIPPPDYDSDRPPDYSFQIESLDNIDERAGSARINGFKDVFLEKNRLELGEDDAEGLSRKYHVIDPSLTEPLAILKIVDLRKAERLGNDIPKLLMKEGDYWSEVEGDMYLWETEEPVEEYRHGRLVKRDYMVMYRTTRGTSVHLGEMDEDGDPLPTKLKFIGEWAPYWQSTTDYMLERCRDSAMRTHESLSRKKLEINDYDLHSWVTDNNCDYWHPNQINVGYEYRTRNGKVTVRGGKVFETRSTLESWARHFKKVGRRLDREFTLEALVEHIDKLSALREGNVMRLRGGGSG